MGKISDLIEKIDSTLGKHKQEFRKEYNDPATISESMPKNYYDKIAPDLGEFDENYAKFIKIKTSNPKDKGEEVENIKVAMLNSAEKVLSQYSTMKKYSTYRDNLSKIGAQLKYFEEEIKKRSKSEDY